MSCERCDGMGWIITEKNGMSGAKMCNCRAQSEQPQGKPLREELAGYIVDALCETLAFAPGPVGRSLVVNALMEMCSTEEQARFVINRACALHTKWETCGIRGLRQILCSRYTPRDGITLLSTDAYPDGIPSLRPPDKYGMPRLPPGRAASADLDCERTILQLGQAKALGDGTNGPRGPVSDIPIDPKKKEPKDE